MLYNDLRKGYIKAYDPKDDQFTKELTVNELINLVGDSVYDENEKLIYKKLDSRSVVKFWLKEDWFFDNERSIMDVRIMGICPVRLELDEDGNVILVELPFVHTFNYGIGQGYVLDDFNDNNNQSKIIRKVCNEINLNINPDQD